MVFVVLSLLLVTNIFYFFNHIVSARQKLYIDNVAFLYFFLFGFIICLFHEIGHASALSYYGKKAGDIGVGFFLFYPVFYCDVSEAWFLKKNERVVVNLGGIYFELLAANLFIISTYMTDNMIYVCLASLILFRTILNLNPFLRRDGYWILSDLTNKPNLQSESIAHFYKTLIRFFKKNNVSFKFSGFLFTYGLLSLSFIILFLLFMVIFNSSSILYFPYRAWDLFNGLMSKGLELNTIPIVLKEFGLPFLFYYLAIKMIFKSINTKFKKYQKVI